VSALVGKVALVTGGSRGLGRAIVEDLAAAGARVAFAFRADVRAADELRGDAIEPIQVDLAADDGAQAAVERTIARFGGLDVLVVNAALWRRAPLLEASPDLLDDLYRINVRSAYLVVQAAARHMVATERRGRIVVVTSRSLYRPRAGSSAYAMTKSAQHLLVRAAAAELAPHGITVNEVAPGPMETEMNRELRDRPDQLRALVDSLLVRRLGQTDEVARAVRFFAADDGGWVTGATLNVDGGGAIA
jgi:NAD(P)-dependent dehydrogenase (short-subunit alcohol dehydrogenase family)